MQTSRMSDALSWARLEALGEGTARVLFLAAGERYLVREKGQGSSPKTPNSITRFTLNKCQ
jgi:hypothetical protein